MRSLEIPLVLCCISLIVLRSRRFSTLFPYTTLFRSGAARGCGGTRDRRTAPPAPAAPSTREWTALQRSEEHTSELQSLRHIVCRLLLEKKKQLNKTPTLPRKPTLTKKISTCIVKHTR